MDADLALVGDAIFERIVLGFQVGREREHDQLRSTVAGAYVVRPNRRRRWRR